jgi:hypothetical protein
MTCVVCGKTYEKWPSRASKSKYCSELCRNQASASKLAKRGDITRAKKLAEAAARRKPPVRVGDHYELSLSNGAVTLVSPEDAEAVTPFSWALANGYAGAPNTSTTTRQAVPQRLLLHRLVMERVLQRPLNPHELIDHKNRDKLDNRRGNLRLATKSQNAFNSVLSRAATSKFKGVFCVKDRTGWNVAITADPVHMKVYSIPSEIEAAYIYDQLALQLHGEFAWLNILDSEHIDSDSYNG